MTKEWGEKYEVSGKGTRNYEEKMIDENLELNKTCKYEDLRKVVEEKKPIITLNSSNNSEIYHFFQDAIVLMRVGNNLLYWFAYCLTATSLFAAIYISGLLAFTEGAKGVVQRITHR